MTTTVSSALLHHSALKRGCDAERQHAPGGEPGDDGQANLGALLGALAQGVAVQVAFESKGLRPGFHANFETGFLLRRLTG
jgi:hypothetical protein